MALEVLKYRNNLASFCQNALDDRGTIILPNLHCSSPIVGVAFHPLSEHLILSLIARRARLRRENARRSYRSNWLSGSLSSE
jgi:hypothetical protein